MAVDEKNAGNPEGKNSSGEKTSSLAGSTPTGGSTRELTPAEVEKLVKMQEQAKLRGLSAKLQGGTPDKIADAENTEPSSGKSSGPSNLELRKTKVVSSIPVNTDHLRAAMRAGRGGSAAHQSDNLGGVTSSAEVAGDKWQVEVAKNAEDALRAAGKKDKTDIGISPASIEVQKFLKDHSLPADYNNPHVRVSGDISAEGAKLLGAVVDQYKGEEKNTSSSYNKNSGMVTVRMETSDYTSMRNQAIGQGRAQGV